MFLAVPKKQYLNYCIRSGSWRLSKYNTSCDQRVAMLNRLSIEWDKYLRIRILFFEVVVVAFGYHHCCCHPELKSSEGIFHMSTVTTMNSPPDYWRKYAQSKVQITDSWNYFDSTGTPFPLNVLSNLERLRPKRWFVILSMKKVNGWEHRRAE
jgi:hypothetical protein